MICFFVILEILVKNLKYFVKEILSKCVSLVVDIVFFYKNIYIKFMKDYLGFFVDL